MTPRPAARLGLVILAVVAPALLSACDRGSGRDAAVPAEEPATPATAAPAAPPPAPVLAAPTAPLAPVTTAEERRRKLREEKDGEAQAQRASDYEGARSAATALPSQDDGAPAPAADTAPASPPSSSPPGQPPG